VVVGDKLIITAAVAEKLSKPKDFLGGVVDRSTTAAGKQKAPDVEIDWQVLALERSTGKPIWSKSVSKGKPKYPVHASNSYATETPCADAERVYTYFGATGIVAAFDHAGNQVWKAELGAYPTVNGFGSGSSPALGKGKLFVTCFNDEAAFVVAFDGKTGREVWRLKWADKGVTAWSSPLVWANNMRTELVVCGPGRVAGLDLDTGKEFWRLTGFETFASSPTSEGDSLYFGTGGQGSRGPLLGIKAGASGDISTKKGDKPSEFVGWNVNGAGTGWCSPLAFNGYLYVPGNGVLSCYDAKTGKQQYKERLPKLKTLVACPVGVGEQILMLDEAGSAVVIKAGPKFEVVGSGKLDDTFWASPAVAGGDLFLRGVEHLFCIKQANPE
jgi:hypothetical protein